MMNSGSPRLLVIPNADLQMENQEPGSYLDQLLTFKKKKSTLEKVKSVLLDIRRMVMKVSIVDRNNTVEPPIKDSLSIKDTIQETSIIIIKDKISCPKLYF